MDTCPKTPLISFCTVQLRTLCATRFLANLCLSTTSGPGPGELPGFWGLMMVFRHAPLPRKGLGNQQQQQYVLKTRSAFFTTYLLRQILFNKTREDTVIGTREHKFLNEHQGSLCVEEFTCDSALPVQEKKRVHTRCKTETTKHIKSSAPLLANSSAASFPSRIGCPGIHCSLIVQEKKKREFLPDIPEMLR